MEDLHLITLPKFIIQRNYRTYKEKVKYFEAQFQILSIKAVNSEYKQKLKYYKDMVKIYNEKATKCLLALIKRGV